MEKITIKLTIKMKIKMIIEMRKIVEGKEEVKKVEYTRKRVIGIIIMMKKKEREFKNMNDYSQKKN